MARKKAIASDSEDRAEGTMDSRVRYWLDEIEAAQKREKDWRKEGQKILDIYGAKDNKLTPYNILYSNTETLLPAVYSAIPRPVVSRRFKDDDPIGKEAADAGRRMLEFLIDTNIEGYETYDEGMRSATLDGLLPGRGVTCIKYDAEVGELPTESVDDEVSSTSEEEAEPVEEQAAEGSPYKKSELVCVDTRSWNRVFFGYAKKWSKVPWIAYEEYIDEEEAERLFGAEVAAKLKYTDSEQESKDSDDTGRSRTSYDDRNEGMRKTACIYQIWDKAGGKKIRYISSQYADGYLKVDDDPLELTGFYNCPKPLMFIEKSNDLLPVALYKLYENQAAELNEITRRITRVVRAIKAKAVYDSELGDDIKNLVEADDNELVPADKTSSLAAEKGLQNAIWFWPIEQLVNTLNQLIVARDQCKRVIFEVTGISDIIRGSSVASETATAQNLKSQWGTMRLKRLQKEVQRYARDILRMMLEVAATKFSEETWAKMTGLPFLLDAKYNELTQVAKALQVQVQMEMSQQSMQPGQQPAPQSQTQQQLAQVMEQLKILRWADVLALLRDDMQRAYRIDIETNSTIEPEAAEDQKNISDLLNALGQYLNGVGPLVSKGMLPFGVAQNMMLAISRRFRFGTEIEDDIKKMQAPPPEDNGKAAEQAKMQAEQQQAQADRQFEMEKAKAEEQRIQQVELAKHQREVQAEQNKMASEQARMAFDRESKAIDVEANRQSELAKLNAQRQTEQMKAKMQQETELQKTAMTIAGQIEIAKINAMSAASEKEQPVEKDGADANQIMQSILETQGKLLEVIAAPKQIRRDAQGRAMGLEIVR